MTTSAPEPGHAETLAPGLRRILAPNPSPMTHWGTNTYLVGEREVAVIDPGPDHAGHMAEILRAAGAGRISHILVTHAHLDHAPLARPLSRATGAPVLAYGGHRAGRSEVMQRLAAEGLAGGGEGVDAAFAPDETLADGVVVSGEDWTLTAHWTPGHFGNHLCFSWEGAVFTGDLVMGWASSLVSPPDGDLTDFMASCAYLQTLDAEVFHSGHGAPIDAPAERLDWLIGHRRDREAQILDALSHAPRTPSELTAALYSDTPVELHAAAQRNVFAHLVDLTGRGRVGAIPRLSPDATFMLV